MVIPKTPHFLAIFVIFITPQCFNPPPLRMVPGIQGPLVPRAVKNFLQSENPLKSAILKSSILKETFSGLKQAN